MINRTTIIFTIYLVLLGLFFSFRKDDYNTESFFRFLGVEELIIIFVINLITITIAYIAIPIGGGVVLPYILVGNIVSYIKKSEFTALIDILTLVPHGVFEFLAVYIIFEKSKNFFCSIDYSKGRIKESFNERCLGLYKEELLITISKIAFILILGSIIETYISNRIYYLFYRGFS